ncbi:AAA family ATPase, partial [Cysteiniphilum sp. SYW-8]|uniref:AAA family ATPase n=1 Tax=Cysteiniphilum sp. SYW-8 TaxID=2610890 RepID=UPI00123D6F8D
QCVSPTLFNGLYIEDKWDWQNKHPIIHLSFGSSQSVNAEETLLQIIKQTLHNTAKHHHVELPPLTLNLQFDALIKALSEKCQQRVVLLIDEYDKPILDVIDQPEKAIRNREILKGVYSTIKDNDAHLRFVFLTGVSKFSKVSLFSGLNNLEDISLHHKYADICGYTQAELEDSFRDDLHNTDLAKLKAWYNGYNFAGTEAQKVYNPFDILLFLSNGQQYKNYWFETGTPSFLVKLIAARREIVPTLENYEANLDFINSIDVNNIPIPALMLQAGYLTIKEAFHYGEELWYRLGYPNFEVKTSLNRHLATIGTATEDANSNQVQLNKGLISDDWQHFELAIQSFFNTIPYHFYSNAPIHDYEAYYCAIVYSYFMALGYKVTLEDTTSQGRIDMSIHMPQKKVILFEFKVADGKDLSPEALAQIIEKNYAQKFVHLNLPIYQIGVSFDRTTHSVNGFVVQEY